MRRTTEAFKIARSDSPETLGQRVAKTLAQSTCDGNDIYKIVNAIKEEGASLKATYEGKPALQWSVTWEHKSPFDAIVLKQDKDVINAQDLEAGWTALMRAVWIKNNYFIETLEAADADPRITALDKKTTAITLARDFGNDALADRLQAKADALDLADAKNQPRYWSFRN